MKKINTSIKALTSQYKQISSLDENEKFCDTLFLPNDSSVFSTNQR